MAVLYLKPAYAIPNIAGNAALNIAQQGPHAMVNWWRSNSGGSTSISAPTRPP
jgi:hypothetical protein